MTTLDSLFRRDPTRTLEEVQKINARERAETDVEEFHETESAESVLTTLGDIVETHPGEGERFLYVNATFGSGKTHLLKLIGLVADTDPELAPYGDRLAERWTGFDELQSSIASSHVDRLVPVFLNLLERDASREPPISFLVFEALGRERGYPTDLHWLLEWAWSIDMSYDDLWDAVQQTTHEGQGFEEAIADRASLRRWLYEALPALPETTGTELDSQDGVKQSIERAERDVDPDSFTPAELVKRIETATEAMNDGESGRTEFLFGLDEVALFIGDSPSRFREFEETMDALQHGPNPVMITTGQYPLPATREKLVGAPPDDHWCHQQVPLEGADTEIIVRKRWLQKNSDGQDRVEDLLRSTSDLSLDAYTDLASVNYDPVESYPFREYDLRLLRSVLQELITRGRSTDRDYIQGRALLVLVRSLFTKFDWASEPVGSLVTWDELFDLLVEETTYVPLWVEEMLENTLIPTFDGDERAPEVRVAKALYLLNKAPGVPATSTNLGRLMIDTTGGSLEDVVEWTTSALDSLVDRRKVLTESTDRGDEVYTLVSEEQESLLRRAEREAEQISPHQLSAWLETRLRENEKFFRSDGTLHVEDVASERRVPLRYEYSILDSVDRAPTTEHDALGVRVLANDPQTVSDAIDTWQEVNTNRDGGEHLLIAIDVPETTLTQIQDVIGMSKVLQEEVESHDELESEHRAKKLRLESSMVELLETATIYTRDDRYGRFEDYLESAVADQLQHVFGATRRVLSTPLREQDDAQAMATFFRGAGEWPLSDADAVLFGVDTSSAELTTGGWCREFIGKYESRNAIDVETLLQQTRIAGGDLRGTPRETIAGLLITLATSNEHVALKRDTEYLSDPTDIGRAVSTKGGLTSIQVRFGVDGPRHKEVRTVVATLLGHEPEGDDPDEWVANLESWVRSNSNSVKRTFKTTSTEFDVSLDALESALSPAYIGDPIERSDLVVKDVQSQAEVFVDARTLLGTDGESESSLWRQFCETLALMEELYGDAKVTGRLRKTAGGESVPTKETVTTRITSATDHRVKRLTDQFRRITGTEPTATVPAKILEELSVWLRNHESDVQGLLDRTTDRFADVSFDDLASAFQVAWRGDQLDEATLVDADVVTQAETLEQARALLVGDPSLWSQLDEARDKLQADYEKSPTTASVEALIDASRPPSADQVHHLLDQAENPIVADGNDDWTELQRLSGPLQRELPDSTVTREVVRLAGDGNQPTDQRAKELLAEAQTVLSRVRTVREALEDPNDGDIVVIE